MNETTKGSEVKSLLEFEIRDEKPRRSASLSEILDVSPILTTPVYTGWESFIAQFCRIIVLPQILLKLTRAIEGKAKPCTRSDGRVVLNPIPTDCLLTCMELREHRHVLRNIAVKKEAVLCRGCIVYIPIWTAV
uniref:Uncharacterized protein n=1 Tax=Ascaris lumbricoides TaxID=6252 RepID=A0A0M3HYB8_ASCLU